MTVIEGVVMALAAISAIGVVASPQTLYSALSLVVTVAMLAVLFLLLNAQFLFAVQLIIYAGAVMVLFVFIIALLEPKAEERPKLSDPRSIVGIIAIAATTTAIFVGATNGVTYASTCDAGNICMRGAAVGQSTSNQNADPYKTFSYPAEAVNQQPDSCPPAPQQCGGNIQTVAGQVFTTFLLPFEITSLLLLVAAIGAVYLTRKSGPKAGGAS